MSTNTTVAVGASPPVPAADDPLYQEWHGKLVPWSYEPGFIALSFVVSLIGAATTLELIQRRTAQTGRLNNVLLIGAAISMGGVAIWSMHYVGNRAIIIAAGEAQLQIAYSSSFTVLSLFVPILVLLAAFVATGTSNRVSWWRVGVGGTLAGLAICGMHYLGNASISNYACEYDLVNVVAAAVIAVVASAVALAIFFVFKSTWTSAWWKRTISEIILAGAVSGMHWCASGGTHYRLVQLRDMGSSELSRNTTVVIVICLAVGASMLMGALAIYLAYVMKRVASRAQKVQLAAAIFDDQGRVLVNRDGLLPSEKITDSFFEKTPQDSLSVAHPLFHWMFQASRNWNCVAPLVESMYTHLAQLSRNGRGTHKGIQLATSNREPVKNYDTIVRELFCTAAATLASRLKTNLEDLGTLWDEILATGGSPPTNKKRAASALKRQMSDSAARAPDLSFAEKGFRFRVEAGGHDVGRGSLLFLVRRVQSATEAEALEAAGFRFAELYQVSNIISTKMQIRTRELEAKLRNMAQQAGGSIMLEPGVHLGFFGVRARSGGGFGFDVMVRNGARNLLPSVTLGVDRLDKIDRTFLEQLDRMSVNAMLQVLRGDKLATPFGQILADSLRSLRGWVDDPILSEAMVTSKVVEVPCGGMLAESGVFRTATLIALRIVIPTTHQLPPHSRCELVPLGLFKVHQVAYKHSPHHEAFSRSVQREIALVVDGLVTEDNAASASARPTAGRGRSYAKLETPSKVRSLETAVDVSQRDGQAQAAAGEAKSGWKGWLKKSQSSPELKNREGESSEGAVDGTAAMGRLSLGVTSKHSSSSLKFWRDRASGSADGRAVSSHGTSADGASSSGAPACGNCGRFGGILVSQEVTVDVRDGEVADDFTRSCCSAAAAAARAAGDTKEAGGEGDEVEMAALGGGKGHSRGDSGGAASLAASVASVTTGATGTEFRRSNVEAEKEMGTFVDELFTLGRY